MPNFKIVPESNKSNLVKDIKDISYVKLGHQPHFKQLKHTILSLNKQHNINFPRKHMIILGAVLFTQARIEEEYSYRNPSNSELYRTLSDLPHLQLLSQAEDAQLVKSFALSAFSQWYNDTAYNIEDGEIERVISNPLCEKGNEYEQFEPILKKVTKDLPEANTKHFKSLFDQIKSKKKHALISECGYSLETVAALKAPSETESSDRSWGQFIASRPVIGAALGITNSLATATGLNFWSSAEPKEPQNQVEAKVETVNSPTA